MVNKQIIVSVNVQSCHNLYPSYQHRLTITCLLGTLPVVCFIYHQYSTTKLLTYCGHLQVFDCTVQCLEFIWKPKNSATFFCPGWVLHMQTGPGTLNHTGSTGNAAVTSKFNCNQLMSDLLVLPWLSLYNYCIPELYKKGTQWTGWGTQIIDFIQHESHQAVILLKYLWIIYVVSALFSCYQAHFFHLM